MENIALIVISVCLGLWLLLAFYIIISFIFITPYYPSRIKDINAEWEKLKINLNTHKTFVDLGSGDGRIVRLAANKGLTATGIELNPFLSLLSKLLILLTRTKNAQIINGNFYKIDFSKYDIVYLYIYKEHMNNLFEKLANELKPGSIIISNIFTFNNFEPDYKGKRLRKYIIK